MPARPALSRDRCDFATCGAGGLCLPVSTPSLSAGTPATVVAACACVPGATARATFAPDGSPTVICQDGRMSFLNAGDQETPDSDVLPDACAGYTCGEHGQCIAMNLTPTCVCDQGFVAVGDIDAQGTRRVSCVEPDDGVPAAFYDKRLPVLPVALPGGRDVGVPAVVLPPVTTPSTPDVMDPPSAGFPMPRGNPDYSATTAGSSSGGGCTVAHPAGGGDTAAGAAWLAACVLGASRLRRGARARR